MTPKPSLPARFHGMRPLGMGAFGQVYAASDEKGRPVALKVLTQQTNRPEVVWQFLAEFRNLERFSHPALPSAYEEGLTAEGLPYFSMTLMPGAPLDAAPCPPVLLRRVLMAIATVLSDMHDRGWVHGDLKRENVLVTAEGGVSLIDLGLMAPTGQRRVGIAGTPEYLAPEVFRKAPCAPAADLYALGVLGYELRTGHLPFVGGLPQLLQGHLQMAVPPIAAEFVDAELDALLLRLLAKDPAQRPPSAWALRVALGETIEAARPQGRKGLVGGTFVGRATVLAAWQEVLAAARGQLTLVGPPGAGKSRTLDEFRLMANMQGAAFYGVTCRGDSDAPAAPIRALLRQVFEPMSGTEDSTMPPEDAENLAAWLMGLATHHLETLEPLSRKAAVFAAVRHALDSWLKDRKQPLVLVIDDWHRADAATREWVTQLQVLRRDAPVIWLFATTEQPETGCALPTLDLAAFDLAEQAALLESRLGSAAPTGLAAWLAQMVATIPGSDGTEADQGVTNLEAWNALLEEVVAMGALAHDGEGWHFDARAVETAAGAPGLAWLYEARLAALPDTVRRLLAIAALAAPAGPLPIPVLAAIAELEPANLDLTPAVALGALVLDGGQAQAQGGVPALALAGIDARTQQHWVEALATHLQAVGPDGLPAAAALLLAAARQEPDSPLAPRAVRVALEAARQAFEAASPAAAWALLTDITPWVTPQTPVAVRRDFTWLRAETGRWLDHLEDATHAYTEARRLADELADAERGVLATFGEAKCRQMQGHYADAQDLYLAAIEQAELADRPLLAARSHAALARVYLFRGQPEQGQAACRAAIALAQGEEGRVVRAQALNFLGVLISQADSERQPEGRALAEEALALARVAGDRVVEGAIAENLGNIHLAIGDLAPAAQAYERAYLLNVGSGATTEALGAQLNLAIVEAERTPGEAALAKAIEVEERAAEIGRSFFVGAALAAQGTCLMRLGRILEGQEALGAAVELAIAIKNKYLEEHVRLVQLEAQLEVAKESPFEPPSTANSGANQHPDIEALETLLAASGHAEALDRLALARATLAQQAGEAEAALALVAPLIQAKHRLIAHGALRLRAQLHLADGKARLALDDACAALAIAAQWAAPWHQARDMALEALALRALGREADAALIAPPAPVQELPRDVPASAPSDEPVLCLLPPADKDGSTLEMGRIGRFLAGLAIQTDETTLGRYALQALMHLTACERGYILLYEDGSLSRVITSALDYEAEVAGGFSRSITEEVLFSGETVYVMDAMQDPTWRSAASVMAMSLKTVLCLPLATADHVLGVVYMDRQTPDPLLNPGDLAALTAIATTVAGYMVRERALAGAAKQREALTAEVALVKQVAVAPDLTAARRTILRALIATSQAERGFWLLPDDSEATSLFWQTAIAESADARPLPAATARPSAGITEWVAVHDESMCILDAGASVDWQNRQSIQALGLRTVWCVPVRDRAASLIYLDTSAIAQTDPEATLQALENQLAITRPLLAIQTEMQP